MRYAAPGTAGAKVTLKSRYANFIGGQWLPPASGEYFENLTPITGKTYCEIPRSNAADIERALDAAHAAKTAWGKTAPAERAALLLKIADRMEQNLEMLAVAETWDNGKPIRESLAADLPLAVDHWRYFAGVLRAQEGALSQIDADTVAYHFHEPLGVVGQIIPWNFPLLMATWKLAPALAAGNCVVLKPAEQTPVSILVLMELLQDLLPPGVVNVVNGFGVEAGKPLASSPRIAKIAFTGETTTGRLIMQYASANLIPVTLELGGKSPNIFFDDVGARDDAFFDKALEGFAMFALNQGEVCTCPSRALIQESLYDRFMERALKRVAAIRGGDPLDTDTMVGAQSSPEQLEKILSYIAIGRQEGAQVLAGGAQRTLEGELAGGYYVEPTVFKGHNRMRIFQEEIFGPVVSVTTFKDEEEALAIANDTLYGLGAAVWSREQNVCHRMARAIQSGRVWVNAYHLYPAHAAFGGYKQSGIGRECHKMMLAHYQQTKNVLVSYSEQALGFFLTDAEKRHPWPFSARSGAGQARAALHESLAAAIDSCRGILPRLGCIASMDVTRVTAPPRVVATAAALALIERLAARHGELMFHQSGGCCDGSSPMCYPRGDLIIGAQDVYLGDIGGQPFYIGAAQYEYWKHTQIIIDAIPGRGGMFSLEGPEGMRFISRGRLFDDAEWAALEGQELARGSVT